MFTLVYKYLQKFWTFWIPDTKMSDIQIISVFWFFGNFFCNYKIKTFHIRLNYQLLELTRGTRFHKFKPTYKFQRYKFQSKKWRKSHNWKYFFINVYTYHYLFILSLLSKAPVTDPAADRTWITDSGIGMSLIRFQAL